MKSSKTILFAALIALIGLTVFTFRSGFFNNLSSKKTALSDFNGHYENCHTTTTSIKKNPTNTCNYIDIATIDGKTSISGQAYYLSSRQVNTGEIKGEILIRNNVAFYDDGYCKINLNFSPDSVTLAEVNEGSCGGLNVTFDGTYIKK